MNVFWDYDGTLMDTYPVMVRCLEDLMLSLGITLPPGRAMAWMKDSLSVAVANCSGLSGMPEKELLAAFRSMEAQREEEVHPCQGMRELMEEIHRRGGRQFLVTHRDRNALRVLERFGMAAYLTDAVTSECGFPRKPAPDSILSLMHRYGILSGVMIGDRPLDVLAGAGAGIDSILLDPEDRFPDTACTWRVRSAEEIRQRIFP